MNSKANNEMPDTDNDLENRSFPIGRPNIMYPRLAIFDFYLLGVGRGERDTAFPFHAKLLQLDYKTLSKNSITSSHTN